MAEPKKLYVVEVSYRGYDSTLDRRIEKAAGRPSDGSGAYLSTLPWRDLTWDYTVKRYAEALVKRLKAARITHRCGKKIEKIKVQLHVYED